MKRALVLDACQRSALAVTRSLGSHGISLVTADEHPSALAGKSKYSKQYFAYPSPRTQPDNFITTIIQLCESQDIDIIFPMTELTSGLLLEHQDKLAGVTLPFTDKDSIYKLSNKYSLMKLAESLEIPVPRTWYIDGASNLSVSLDELDYPLVIKPGKSWLKTGNEWLHTEVKIAQTSDEARRIINEDPALNSHPFLLQKYVPGNGEGIFALYENGSPVAFFAHKRLREKPPRGGVSVLSESIEANQQLLSYSRTLLDKAIWHGIAMVEFRVKQDGTPYLMEINTRFWGSLQLAIDAGIDFPWLLYQVACNEKIPHIKSYIKGKRLRWILGDLDSLYLLLRDKDFSFMDKVRGIFNFIMPQPFKTRHEVNRLTDLGPFWWELKQYLKDLRN